MHLRTRKNYNYNLILYTFSFKSFSMLSFLMIQPAKSRLFYLDVTSFYSSCWLNCFRFGGDKEMPAAFMHSECEGCVSWFEDRRCAWKWMCKSLQQETFVETTSCRPVSWGLVFRYGNHTDTRKNCRFQSGQYYLAEFNNC